MEKKLNLFNQLKATSVFKIGLSLHSALQILKTSLNEPVQFNSISQIVSVRSFFVLLPLCPFFPHLKHTWIS